MAESETQQEVAGQTKSIEDLKTPEDYLDFTIEKVSQSLKKLAGKTDWFGKEENGKPIVEEEIEQIKRNLQELFDIYRYGGELGGHRFLPHKLPAHGSRHVLLQTAFKADLATAVALMDEKERPFYSKDGSRSFGYTDWKTEVYSSVLHEIGYLRVETFAAAGRGGFSQRAQIEGHEKRGAEFAKGIGDAWKLADQGVDMDQVQENIRATEMSGHKPIHFEKLRELSWEEVSHLTDLLSYVLAPDYIPDVVAGLWWEWKGFVLDEEGKLIDFAEKKYATLPLASYIAKCFLKPGTREDGQLSFGEGPANLIQALFQVDENRFAEWKQSYDRNADVEEGREATLVKMINAPKLFDGLQLEGSINPHLLASVAEKYLSEKDFREFCVRPFEEMLQGQLGEGTIFERLPSRYLRRMFEAVADREAKKGFLTELIEGAMRESAEENSQTIQIKLSPYAWQFEAGVGIQPTLEPGFFVDCFQEARTRFLESEKSGKRTEKEVQLAVTLRREDGLAKNRQLVQELTGRKITQFDIAGDERKPQWRSADTIEIAREIKSSVPEANIAIVLGQLGPDEDSSQALEDWRAVSAQADISELLNSVCLMKNEAFRDAALDTNAVVMFPISQALLMGYSEKEIVQFIRDFPEKGRLKLISVSGMLGSLSLQLFRLFEAGLSEEELKELGVELTQ